MMIHVDEVDFLNKAMLILDKKGSNVKKPILGSNELDARMYWDSLIKIIMSDDGKWGEMERMENHNTFFMKYNGEIIRFHGEFAYLENHINSIWESIK